MCAKRTTSRASGLVFRNSIKLYLKAKLEAVKSHICSDHRLCWPFSFQDLPIDIYFLKDPL
jgi:hypothetical protein